MDIHLVVLFSINGFKGRTPPDELDTRPIFKAWSLVSRRTSTTSGSWKPKKLGVTRLGGRDFIDEGGPWDTEGVDD